MLSTIVKNFSMNINLLVIFESFYKLPCLFQSVLETIGIGPSEISRVITLLVEHIEMMGPSQREPIVCVTPSDFAATSFPFFCVGQNSEHRFQPGFVQLPLVCHVFDVEGKSVTIFYAFDRKVKPCLVMANFGVR